MAVYKGSNNFVEEIAFLESMFGGTVSSAVITSVLESCDGNVHLAADAIMNFSDELCTPQSEKPPTEEKESKKKAEETPKVITEITSNLNISAPPFEFRLPNVSTSVQTLRQDTDPPPSLEKITISNHGAIINSQQSPTAESLEAAASIQQSPRITSRPSSSVYQELPSTSQQPPVNQPPLLNQQPSLLSSPLSPTDSTTTSFSQACRNSGARPKKPPDSKAKSRFSVEVWPDQISKVLHLHNEGTRTLIIMRGAAGSGKSHLAKQIVDYTVGPSSENYDRHIFSSDSYFTRGGDYQFNKNTLEQAHSMNQRRVKEAASRGVSPIIVDNTNTELWEMDPYIRVGVRNGYVIEFIEPNTPWARNANQLCHKNVHYVNRETIRRMLDRFDRRITPETAIRGLRLSYPANRVPPQLRNIPPFSPPLSPRDSPKRRNPDNSNQGSNAINKNSRRESPKTTEGPSQKSETEKDSGDINTPTNDTTPDNNEHENKLKIITDAQKEIERFEKVEQEWENGESWDNTTDININNNVTQPPNNTKPKPQRRPENIDDNAEKLIGNSNICDDWTKISMFMPPWQDTQSTNNKQAPTAETTTQKEKVSASTGFEATDMDETMYKILYGTPQSINENTEDKTITKIPLVVMLDKSTSTHENDVLSKQKVCKNIESHFRELRRMFRPVPRDILRDIFESCNFDVNWAVNLVLDSYPESQTNIKQANESDSDEEVGQVAECNCLASYSIVPDVTPAVETPSVPEPEPVPVTTPVSQKKTKRENKSSDNSLQLKRQIESNIIISENHYSQHYLNMRRRRENNVDRGDEESHSTSNADIEDVGSIPVPEGESGNNENATALPESLTKDSTSSFPTDTDVANYNVHFLDDFGESDTESDSAKSDNLEKTVTINLGTDFIFKLDELFGRQNFQYPENVRPVVNLPVSLLQQINAHWAMSVAYQLDDVSRQSAMIKQDEEFARQLAAKEQEMSEEGKEPDVPSLKEIMEFEIAYAIYEREIAEWRNSEPNDLAAKLTREKLYNLFPDLSKEVLSEVLMAHDYSFKATIESLIISTGQANWLEDEKGVEKFVMHKEMERKEKFMEEQKKELDETEWPYLSSQDKPVTLDTVNFYRAEAEKSLRSRNMNFEKARLYFNRNSPSAASFYSEIAALHTKRYEQSSCLAAAYLMNYHLKNNPDQDVLDLHYLRVSEAIVNLDIFIDQIILRLRTKNIRYKETWIITGRGTHSIGGPRIKPAAKKRLKYRGIMTKQVNDGLIMATLYSTDKMTDEIEAIERI